MVSGDFLKDWHHQIPELSFAHIDLGIQLLSDRKYINFGMNVSSSIEATIFQYLICFIIIFLKRTHHNSDLTLNPGALVLSLELLYYSADSIPVMALMELGQLETNKYLMALPENGLDVRESFN